jgi:hypothetical protein
MYFENPAFTYSETPVPAIHRNYAGAAGPPLLSGFSGAFLVSINGTGSSYSAEAYLTRCGGYDLFPIERATAMPLADLSQRYVKLMRDIQSGFDRTLSRLPSVFGVSRQTLYNWRAGETPKPQHEQKLVQVAAAARVFSKVGFKPTATMLDRTVADGKSILTLLAEGADGASTAEALVRIVQRGLDARARLEKALEGRPVRRSEPSDFGAPAFEEDI